MLERLHSYLGDITTPENQTTLTDACRLLENSGIHSHYIDLEAIFGALDNYETETNLQDIYSLLVEYVETAIREFGLHLQEGIALPALNQIFQCLLTIPNFGDPDAILLILEKEVGVEEKVCDIFELVSPLKWYDFAPYITYVNPALLERVDGVVSANLPPEEERVDVSKYRDRWVSFKSTRMAPVAENLIYQGYRLGSDLDELLEGCADRLGELENSPPELAHEVVGILLISNTANSALAQKASELLEIYAKDVNVVTKASATVSTILQEFTDAQA